MSIVLYGNGSSGNHGCEAIVRGTASLLGEDMLLQSEDPREDKKYGLDKIVRIRNARTGKRPVFPFLQAYLKYRLTGDYYDLDGLAYLPGIRSLRKQERLALSVGGDNYCYGGTGLYAYLNRQYHKNGFKTVLWGCSINPEVLEDKAVREDLFSYDLITARESITFECLRQHTDRVLPAPDPAFFMPPCEVNLSEHFLQRPVVGVNVSPMVLSYADEPDKVIQNYKEMIRFIIRETDSCVALIPHVVWQSNDDRAALKILHEAFRESGRVFMIKDCAAPALKYIISRCSCFVGARTHATVAAYSMGVPTLSVGYSVKARGIARDLFGSEEGYSVPVGRLDAPKVLCRLFEDIYADRERIERHLENKREMYLSTMPYAIERVKQLGQI